ncbi:hypothetical protein Plhal304r1_c023g0079321 [Plasmopara halstedii]
MRLCNILLPISSDSRSIFCWCVCSFGDIQPRQSTCVCALSIGGFSLCFSYFLRNQHDSTNLW